MAAVVSLAEALADRRLFRGGQPLARGQGATPSGFDALDEVLPWHGFPRGALTEILLPAPGLGEIELLSQAWARIGEKERLAFVAPPCIPYAPALLRAQWPLARFAWIEAPAAQAAWAAEQCLRAGCLGAVALWLPGGDDKSLRRLQLAAEEGSVHAFLFRPVRHAANASPAALRLVLEPASGLLKLRVLKVRGAVAPSMALERERTAAAARPATTVRGELVEPPPHAHKLAIAFPHTTTARPATTVRGEPVEPTPQAHKFALARALNPAPPVRGEPVQPTPRAHKLALSLHPAKPVRGEPVEPTPRAPGSFPSPRTDFAV